MHLFTVAFCRSEILRIGSLQSDFCKEGVLQNALCEKSRKKGSELHVCTKSVLQNGLC